MEYNFTIDILDIIKHKTSDLFNKLNKSVLEKDSIVSERDCTDNQQSNSNSCDSSVGCQAVCAVTLSEENNDCVENVENDTQIQDFLEDFKLFHNDSRTNITLLKYIIHKKIEKIEESDKIILFNDLKEFENNQEITELIWDYIHSVYLLHEYALPEPNKEILSALIKKINVESENNNSLVVINDNKFNNDINEEDIFENIKEKKEFKMFNNVLESITKNMNIDTSSANTSFINDIMDDIKTNINNSDGVDDLFNSTKNISEKYKNLFDDGKITMNDLMSGMINIISKPQNITDTIKDINVNKLPDMSSIMNKLASEVNTNDDLKNMMNTDMLKNMNFNSNNKEFNPMDIISNMMGGMNNNATASKDVAPLTDDQLIEMENFYSNLNIGKE
jgi:hypothetical protein